MRAWVGDGGAANTDVNTLLCVDGGPANELASEPPTIECPPLTQLVAPLTVGKPANGSKEGDLGSL